MLSLDLPPLDWSQHAKFVVSTTRASLLLAAAAYSIAFLLCALPHQTNFTARTAVSFCLGIGLPSLFAYVLIFRLGRLAHEDFQDRVWHSERLRGRRAGDDVDRDGQVASDERIEESAEWANALLTQICPRINPDLYV